MSAEIMDFPDLDGLREAFKIAWDAEELHHDIEAIGHLLQFLGAEGDITSLEDVIYWLGKEISDKGKQLEERRERLAHLLHPYHDPEPPAA